MTITTITLFLLSVGWPLAPQNTTHPLGNNWPEFQDYGGSPYFHNGVDVMGITVGRPVYAVQRGFVKAWLTTQAQYHWRLAIADTNLSTDSVNAWLYAHIDQNQYHKNVGDVVNTGDLIGYLVQWPVVGFDHCHFARIRDIGSVWNTADWAFIENPLLLMTPYADTAIPVFETAYGSNLFAICQNNTSTYLQPNNVTGSVDIIAKIYDKTGLPLTANPEWEKLVPYRITYEIHGPQNQPSRLSFVFRGRMDYTSLVSTVFKDDATCNSRGDYDYRDYYFIITNTDGDSLIESTDAANAWNTTGWPGGNYWVVVTAYDAAGNFKIDSMRVTLPGQSVEETTKNVFSEASSLLSLLSNPRLSLADIIMKTSNVYSIYDSHGRIVQPAQPSNLNAGVYFLVSKSKKDNRIQTQKIVVVK